jgi:predicted transcriptional regulator
VSTLRAYKAVWESDLAPTDRLALLALVAHLPNCEPSVARLAAHTALCSRTIRRALVRLSKRGLVATKMRSGRHNTFKLHLERLTTACESPRIESHPTPDGESSKVSTSRRKPER